MTPIRNSVSLFVLKTAKSGLERKEVYCNGESMSIREFLSNIKTRLAIVNSITNLPKPLQERMTPEFIESLIGLLECYPVNPHASGIEARVCFGVISIGLRDRTGRWDPPFHYPFSDMFGREFAEFVRMVEEEVRNEYGSGNIIHL